MAMSTVPGAVISLPPPPVHGAALKTACLRARHTFGDMGPVGMFEFIGVFWLHGKPALQIFSFGFLCFLGAAINTQI